MRVHPVAAAKKLQAGEKSKPGPVNYFAAFDRLNEDSPVLIGFVRQPASHRQNLEALDSFWGASMERDSESPGGILQKAGFDAVTLSVYYRPATPAEISAYESVSRKLGGVFRFILKDGRARSPGYHINLTDPQVLPAEIRDAAWEGPLLQMLIGNKWSTRDRVYLFDFIQGMPLRQRNHLLARLVDLEGVSMHDFASNAADAENDAVVLASGLHDVWRFQAQESSWTATLDAGSWLVRLHEENAILTLQLVSEGSEFIQQLSPFPYKRTYPMTRPYAGRLSSLFNLMTHLTVLYQDGRTGFEARFGETSSDHTGPYWYRKLIETLLHGRGGFSDLSSFTEWPNLKNKFTVHPAIKSNE